MNSILANNVTNDVALSAKNIAKQYKIYLNDRNRFFEFFGYRRRHEEHWALKDVSFEVKKGSSFGIIGANGAGKSTMLRLLAGISEPSSGTLSVNGSFATLLDLGLGFHPTFTGRENIFLNCSLLGLPNDQVKKLLPQIIAFAELEEFIDFPVRTYSSGMNLRLGFAIASHLDTEMLFIDEVLAVGDQYFQRKCVHKIERFVEEGRTIVLVSHDLHAVRSLCDTVMWLDHGIVKRIGPSREVVGEYLDLERARAASGIVVPGPMLAPSPDPTSGAGEREVNYSSTVDDSELRRCVVGATHISNAKEVWEEKVEATTYEEYDGERAVVIGSGEVRVLNVKLLDENGMERERFSSGEDLVVAVTFRTTEPVQDPIMGVAIHRNDGIYVFGPNNRFDGVLSGLFHGIYTYFIHYPKLPLLAGHYRVSIAVFDKNHLKPHVWHNQLYDFEVAQQIEDHGFVRLDHAWGLVTHVEGEEADVKAAPHS